MNDEYFNLGGYTRNISTKSKQAQIWFNRGLNWCYGFNQEEAVRCFQQAIKSDPECAMASWGVAHASSPFYNKPWECYGEHEKPKAVKFCFEYAQKAWSLKSRANEVEKQLIEALVLKHPCDRSEIEPELTQWNIDYANAMRAIYHNFPDDLDVICLTAESLINLTPWKLWDLQKGTPSKTAFTEESIAILQHGIDLINGGGLQQHPGIVHFYIHIFEMSPTPEKALPLADELRDLCPDCGHLLHMASHIDALCGQWREAVTANSRAIDADLKYLKLRGTGEFYMISALHNYHFKMYAAMFLGQYKAAMSAAAGLQALICDEILQVEERYLASTLEAYYSSKIHVLVRFGLWPQITVERLPENQSLYLLTTTLLHYAKTIAYAALGDINTARQHKVKFESHCALVPDWHISSNNSTSHVLAVAAAMMNGELEYHAGNHAMGYDYLRHAVALNDQLEYAEPWPWMHPPRHALGALLLEQGFVEEAFQCYEDDLGINRRLPRCVQHQGNIWSLHGYHECLLRLGRDQEALNIRPQLEALTKQADIDITSSCCCRKSTDSI